MNQPDNWSNPTTGLARLFEFLGHCKDFPVSIKTAECVSKIPEQEICNVFKESLHYSVREGEIHKC